MPKITKVRPVLLSAPYANTQTNKEVLLHLPTGYRTCGMVEITLENGITGLGEAYLAVFAPHVFESIVNLLLPSVIGRNIADSAEIYRDLQRMTGYWSLQGAAQHVLSAFEIALCDCRAKLQGIPVYALFNESATPELKLYASGGDSINSQAMQEEIEQVAHLGIDVFKIRARSHEVDKVVWCQNANSSIRIAVDMTQNLAIPSQSIADVAFFLDEIQSKSGNPIAFLEEALGPDIIKEYPTLRGATPIPIAGGEIVTTANELIERMKNKYYDIAQPDATVMGGIAPLLEVCKTANENETKVYVHCWGGAVGMMANYHAAIAAGTQVAELPLPNFPLRDAMMIYSWDIKGGNLYLSDTSGLGLQLNKDIEMAYPFREDATYHCLSGTDFDQHLWQSP